MPAVMPSTVLKWSAEARQRGRLIDAERLKRCAAALDEAERQLEAQASQVDYWRGQCTAIQAVVRVTRPAMMASEGSKP